MWLKKNWPIVAIVLIVIGGVLFFVFRKPGKPKKKNGNGNGNGNQDTGLVFGKSTAYSAYDGVQVYNSDTSLFKTSKKDEWIGIIYGEKNNVWIGGSYDNNTNTWGGGHSVDMYVLDQNQYGKLVDKRDVCYSYIEDGEEYASC